MGPSKSGIDSKTSRLSRSVSWYNWPFPSNSGKILVASPFWSGESSGTLGNHIVNEPPEENFGYMPGLALCTAETHTNFPEHPEII